MLPANPDLPAIHRRHLSHRHGAAPLVQYSNIIHRRSTRVEARAPASTTDSSDSATFSCAPNDRSGPCERMVAASPNTTTIPVVLGVVIPLTFAFVILVVLHRRIKRRLRREDAEDRNRSLDFGIDQPVINEKKSKKRGRGLSRGPEMQNNSSHDPTRKDRQMSLDLAIANPYILPPELRGSRDSIHSLSRSINPGDDKYRATSFIPDDGSLRSPSSLRHRDDASIYTFSSRQRTETESTRGLLPHGHASHYEPVPMIRKPDEAHHPSLLAPFAPDAVRESYVSTDSRNGNIVAMRASNNYLGQYISGGAKNKAAENKTSNPIAAVELSGDVPQNELPSSAPSTIKDASSKRSSQTPANSGFDFGIPANTHELSSVRDSISPQIENSSAQVVPTVHEAPGHDVYPSSSMGFKQSRSDSKSIQHAGQREIDQKEDVPDINVAVDDDEASDYYDETEEGDPYDINMYKNALGYDPRRLTMGMRPLPPDDPSENPEERATRIRSFYKEYFDETTRPGGEKARLSYFDGSENYIDDYYGSANQQDYGYGSQNYGAYNPYSSRGPYRQAPHGCGSRRPSVFSARGPPPRHNSIFSNNSYNHGPLRPRAYSSASNRLAGQKMRNPAKPRRPPQPLAVLPTPSMLKDDSMLPNPIDYAPPQVFKNQRAGTPDSLRGGVRAYSPSTRAYNPLVSSFDDLSVLPSPHQLNKSRTYSNLDFAPPRFATASNAGSDAGSIRSNQSGMSARQLHHIRAGAYRLSRVPKEVAGTKEDLAIALKPQWNAR